MNVQVKGVVLILVGALLVAGCGSPTPAPTSPPPATATTAPAQATATTAPPTTAPDPTATSAPPTVAPTNTAQVAASPTTPRETVNFSWAAGSVTPADADDVTVIMVELRNNPGILSGSGNEIGITIQYDPTVITVEEIADLLDDLGHPVDIP